MTFKKITQLAVLALLVAAFIGCSAKKQGFERALSSTAQPEDDNHANNNGGENLGQGGANVAGQGSFSVPTADAVTGRIQLGLESAARATAGNFALSLEQVKKNLPKTTDPTKATGFEQIQLLVYGACSDLTTGTTPLMQSRYNIVPAGTIASNQASLITAGMRMLDQHTAGIASESTATASLRAAFATLVTKVAGVTGNTSRIAFMSVCIAANTAGSSMLGF